jgi:DNA-binding response OmpR family regulator
MALCECCLAEIQAPAERLPPPWFDYDRQEIAGRRAQQKVWRLLEILWRRRGRAVSRDSIMTLLYSDKADPPLDKVVDVHVSKLRPMLKPTPYAVETDWGNGYRLVENEP